MGNLIKALGGIVFAVTGFWGFFICLGIISRAAGFWGALAVVILAPIAFVVGPLYAVFAWNNWFPLVINYGGGIVAAVLTGIGRRLSDD